MFNFFNRVPSITSRELQTKIKQRAVILDVRSAEEYRGGHISSAINVPLHKITAYQKYKTEQVYLICQSGLRSKKAAKLLKNKGYDVVNVRGGMNSWQGPVKRGK